MIPVKTWCLARTLDWQATSFYSARDKDRQTVTALHCRPGGRSKMILSISLLAFWFAVRINHQSSSLYFFPQFVSPDTCGQDRSKLANWFIKHGAPEDLEEPAPFYVGPVLENPYDNPDFPPTGLWSIYCLGLIRQCYHFPLPLTNIITYRAS